MVASKEVKMTITNLTVFEKARKALQIIKEGSPALLATRPNLYKRCLDGVAAFEALRPRVTATEPGTYHSLAGQQFAQMIANASLDNVLTVLIDETVDHKWSWDVVTDVQGVLFGSPPTTPCETREEAEAAVIEALGQFGQEAKPAEGYEPVPDRCHYMERNTPMNRKQRRAALKQRRSVHIPKLTPELVAKWSLMASRERARKGESIMEKMGIPLQIGIDFRRKIVAKADVVERLLDDIVVARKNEMAGVGGDTSFGHWLFTLTARLVEDADLAFGVWPDASQPDGVGMFVIKGRELMPERPGTWIPVIWTAIPCIHMEYAVALRDLVGDRLQ